MLEVPVRVELKCDLAGTLCRFTIPALQFIIPPGRGDPITFMLHEHEYIAVVQYIHHLTGRATGSIVCCSIHLSTYDDLVSAFDLFKDTMTITDLDMGGVRPPSYYPIYRLIISLWGKKVFNYESDHPTVLAEIVRAVIIAGGGGADRRQLIRQVELIHKLLIEYKQRYRGTDCNLLDLIRDWDKEVNVCATINVASDIMAIEVAQTLIAELQSVPVDKLPVW